MTGRHVPSIRQHLMPPCDPNTKPRLVCTLYTVHTNKNVKEKRKKLKCAFVPHRTAPKVINRPATTGPNSFHSPFLHPWVKYTPTRYNNTHKNLLCSTAPFYYIVSGGVAAICDLTWPQIPFSLAPNCKSAIRYCTHRLQRVGQY